MQISLFARIMIGSCLGIVAGSSFIYYAFPDIRSLSTTPSVTLRYGGVQHVEVRGILREYDTTTRTMLVDAVSPYSSEDTVRIQVIVDERTHILHTPPRFGSEPGLIIWSAETRVGENSLKEGQDIYLLLANTNSRFHAAAIRILT